MSKRLDLLTGKWIEEKPKYKSPEASVGKAVDAYLTKLGGYVRTIKSDGTKMPNGKWRKSAQGSGISDRLAWMPDGDCIAVELKAPGKKRTLTFAQWSFLSNLIMRGHKGCVADCVDDVKLCLKQDQEQMLNTLNIYKPTRKEDKYDPNARPLFE